MVGFFYEMEPRRFHYWSNISFSFASSENCDPCFIFMSLHTSSSKWKVCIPSCVLVSNTVKCGCKYSWRGNHNSTKVVQFSHTFNFTNASASCLQDWGISHASGWCQFSTHKNNSQGFLENSILFFSIFLHFQNIFCILVFYPFWKVEVWGRFLWGLFLCLLYLNFPFSSQLTGPINH